MRALPKVVPRVLLPEEVDVTAVSWTVFINFMLARKSNSSRAPTGRLSRSTLSSCIWHLTGRYPFVGNSQRKGGRCLTYRGLCPVPPAGRGRWYTLINAPACLLELP
uniref:Uncharacterized protein n=1 Tax=Trypanosoma congolense (strain IL3000) TaxID=1068625 RepID=G0UT03_TRYCI|nr:hypothetical protein, unlikely [Trypanosoma congolense IL3000]